MGGSIQGLTGINLTKAASISTFAGKNGLAGSAKGGLVTDARFNQPVGITTDGTDFYVADTANNKIRRINMTAPTPAVEDFAGSGVAGHADSTDGTGATATFNAPTAITYSYSDNCLYVADTGNNSIRKVDQKGVVTTIAGSTTGLAGSIDSTKVPTDARFNQPTGITTDGDYLYVTDFGNHTIRMIVIPKVSSIIAEVTTLAGTPGVAGSDDGAQKVARFNQPVRITTDGTYLYVTDSNNRTIRRIDRAGGSVKTIAGISGPIDSAGNIADSTDGTGKTARFNQPNGITSDGKNLYLTDSFNNSIRKIENPTGTDSSGPVTTLTFTDLSVKLIAPIGITTDGTALYVVDSQNHIIRKIQ
jgi:hypothetical protein